MTSDEAICTAIPIRLLCVSHYFESHRGGIEMVAGRLARSLAQSRVDVTWAACDASPPPTDLPVLPLRASNLIERRSGLPFPLPGPISCARLISAIRRSQAVLVHDGMYPTSVVAIVAARLFRRPVVLVQHIGRVPASSLTLSTLFAIADRFLTRPMLRLASQVVFISATSARHFAEVSTRREPMLIFNGVDTDVFRPSASADDRRIEREQTGWPSDRPVILFVGRFLEKKGLLRLREMATMRPDLHWAFAGWGPCDPAAWNLQNVTVHRDRSGVDLAPLYRAADLLVLPSKSEGFPLVVQEALACGLRPICCDDGANADPAAAGHVTSISNDGSETEVVTRYIAAINALVLAPNGTAERSERAKFARQRYAWHVATQRYRAVFTSLIAELNSLTGREEMAA
jgi:glycosyltransferase involved in cell wall biosynthesis